MVSQPKRLPSWVNFDISGQSLPSDFWHIYAQIKRAAAVANMEADIIDKRRARAIVKVADQIVRGDHDQHLNIDVFQAGAGTATHMQLNELIATRASSSIFLRVEPNNHVNASQSTNDTFPSAMQISIKKRIDNLLIPTLQSYQKTLQKKIKQFDSVYKTGRTHLQDAVPIKVSNELKGYLITDQIKNIINASKLLNNLPLGGTAVGEKSNAPIIFRKAVYRELRKLTGLMLRPSPNLFSATQNFDVVLEVSALLRNLALKFSKISNDFRLLTSGPRTGLAEINLPALQRGSSIMPGKINPTAPEILNMVCQEVIGNDTSVAQAYQAAQLELNVFMPIAAYNVLRMTQILSKGLAAFTSAALAGLTLNKKKIQHYLDRNISKITELVPQIGYEQATRVAHMALQSDKNIDEVLQELGLEHKKAH